MTKNEYYDISRISDEEVYEIRITKRISKEMNAKRLSLHRKIKKDLLARVPKEINKDNLEIIATVNRVLVIYIGKENHLEILKMVSQLLKDIYWNFIYDIYKEDDTHIHVSIKPRSSLIYTYMEE